MTKKQRKKLEAKALKAARRVTRASARRNRLFTRLGRTSAAVVSGLDDVESKATSIKNWARDQVTATDAQNVGRIGRLQTIVAAQDSTLAAVTALRNEDGDRSPTPAPAPKKDPPAPVKPGPTPSARGRGGQFTEEQLRAAKAAGWTEEKLKKIAGAMELAAAAEASSKPSAAIEREYYLPNVAMPEALRAKAKALGMSEEDARKAMRFLGAARGDPAPAKETRH